MTAPLVSGENRCDDSVMISGENDLNLVSKAPKPGSALVRWILVVSLGCSLGLLIVYIVLSTRVIPDNSEMVRVTYHVLQAPFNLSEEPLEKEVTAVIESQLAAFRDGDYPQAYNFAATGLKSQLPLPTFERMVKQGYPGIARSSGAQFGVIVDNGTQAVVNAAISDSSGHTRHYQYILQRERTGWKISGVTEVKAKGLTI